jgi:hypothetical protein
VMPYQVNGQAVATKSQRVSHGAGGDGEAGAAAGGGVFVTMMLSAHASAGRGASDSENHRRANTKFHVVPHRLEDDRSTGCATLFFPDSLRYLSLPNPCGAGDSKYGPRHFFPSLLQSSHACFQEISSGAASAAGPARPSRPVRASLNRAAAAPAA